MQPRNWSPLVGKGCSRGNTKQDFNFPCGEALCHIREALQPAPTPVMSPAVSLYLSGIRNREARQAQEVFLVAVRQRWRRPSCHGALETTGDESLAPPVSRSVLFCLCVCKLWKVKVPPQEISPSPRECVLTRNPHHIPPPDIWQGSDALFCVPRVL